MSIEQKRRELFEAEHQAEHDQLVAEYGDLVPDMGYERFDSGLYKDGLVQAAWWGFNAALDAVVIELPADACARCDTVQEEARQESFNLGIEECRTAIESTGLGLKVKP